MGKDRGRILRAPANDERRLYHGHGTEDQDGGSVPGHDPGEAGGGSPHEAAKLQPEAKAGDFLGGGAATDRGSPGRNIRMRF